MHVFLLQKLFKSSACGLVKVSALDEHQQQRKCTGFESFLKQQELRIYWPKSYTTEKENKLLILRENCEQNGCIMSLNKKNINNF